MGNSLTIQKINFEDIQTIIKNQNNFLLINTLPPNEQLCLILTTTNINNEEILINKYLKENKNIKIIIYGKNCNDETPPKKYQQLLSLGFNNIYLYYGGLFEWLLLQDVYGEPLFPTTSTELDILKYKSLPIFRANLLEYL